MAVMTPQRPALGAARGAAVAVRFHGRDAILLPRCCGRGCGGGAGRRCRGCAYDSVQASLRMLLQVYARTLRARQFRVRRAARILLCHRDDLTDRLWARPAHAL